MENNKLNITGFQRVINTIQGIETDRRAFSLILSLYGSKLISCPLLEYYRNAEKYVQAQQIIVDKFDPDILFTPFALPFEGEAFGSELKFTNNAAPNIKKPAFTDFGFIKDLKIPAGNAFPKQYVLDTIEMLAVKYKQNKIIAGITLSPLDIPAMIMGIEAWLDTIMFHEKEALLLIEKTTQYFTDYVNRMFGAGINAVVLPNAFCNPTIITPKIIEKFALKALHTALAQVPGPVIIHHGGALIVDFLPYYTDLPNVIGFVIDQRESLQTARNKIGNKVLFGNLNISHVEKKSPQVLKEKCLEILEDRKNDPNFIFLNSGPDITLETSEENIKTVCNTVTGFK